MFQFGKTQGSTISGGNAIVGQPVQYFDQERSTKPFAATVLKVDDNGVATLKVQSYQGDDFIARDVPPFADAGQRNGWLHLEDGHQLAEQGGLERQRADA